MMSLCFILDSVNNIPLFRCERQMLRSPIQSLVFRTTSCLEINNLRNLHVKQLSSGMYGYVGVQAIV